ncbi:MAG: alpha/beta fold hydrolase [Burkholderiales bacterium]|nr:alpha/beta fold hydrolase [Burkholderiales bacterium]
MRRATACGPGVEMVWRRWGSGPPAVLLHGGSGAWSHWIRNIDALAPQRTLWVADLPGCGESGLPAGAYDADSIVEHVAAGIAACCAGTPVDLIGFSFGSLVSGLLAATHPELVGRMILVAPPALGLSRVPLELVSLGRAMPPDEREAAVRHNLQQLMLHRAAAIDDLAVAIHATNFERDRLRMRRLSRTGIMQALQRRWRCPVHAIWGREDVLARHELDRLPAVLQHCDLRSLQLIDDAGHWVQYEQPTAFNDAVRAVLP